MKRNTLLFVLSSAKMKFKLKDNFFIIVALMYLQRIPQEMKWESLTDKYICETKRPCMKTRSIRCGISIIFLFYWSFTNRKALINENYNILKNLLVKDMIHFTEKHLVKNIPAVFASAEKQMYGNEVLNAFPFTSENSWVREMNIENFSFLLLREDLIHCEVLKENHRVVVLCTYNKLEAPVPVS